MEYTIDELLSDISYDIKLIDDKKTEYFKDKNKIYQFQCRQKFLLDMATYIKQHNNIKPYMTCEEA